MKKVFITLLLSLILCGCSKSESSEITMSKIVESPDLYIQDDDYNNFIEFVGTVAKTEVEEPTEEYINWCKEKGFDKDFDIYAKTYYIYLDGCNTPLESSKPQSLNIGQKCKFVISVEKVITKYHYNLISYEEL